MEPPAALRKRVFTVAQFCFVYGICRTTAYSEIKAGRLTVIKCGRRTLITEAAAEAWLRALACRSDAAARNDDRPDVLSSPADTNPNTEQADAHAAETLGGIENSISAQIEIAPATKKGRPSTKGLVEKILSDMQCEGFSFNCTHKVLATQVAERNSMRIGDRGFGERTVLQHVSKWLREHPEALRK